MKKKAVFFSQGQTNDMINKVYSTDTIAAIKEFADLYEVIIDTDNMEKNRDYLSTVEVAFSTWGMPAFSEEELEQFFPKLEAVFYAAGSVRDFAVPFLNRDIKVVSAWAANAVPVAEYTLAQILLANKGFFQNSLINKRSNEEAHKFSAQFPGNYSVKVGILGAGMIGRKVIEFLKPFSIQTLVFDPFLTEEKAKELGVEKCSLIEVFSSCQTISCHIANIPETVGMLNKEHFSRMLPSATFINTGRGAQVVEKDLIAALKEVPGRTAVLDVTEPEPVEPDSEFLKIDNVFLTSHIAGSMSNEVERMSIYMAEEFFRFLKGEELKYSVSLKMLETMA